MSAAHIRMRFDCEPAEGGVNIAALIAGGQPEGPGCRLKFPPRSARALTCGLFRGRPFDATLVAEKQGVALRRPYFVSLSSMRFASAREAEDFMCLARFHVADLLIGNSKLPQLRFLGLSNKKGDT